MQHIIDLILKLKDKQINLELQDGNQLAITSEGAIDGSVIEEIRAHKKEIIDYYLSIVNVDQGTPIHALELKDGYDISPAQKRLWILDQIDQQQNAYNIHSVYRITGPLQVGLFNKAFKTLIRRHESLRTRFENKNGQPMQCVVQAEEVDFSIIERTIKVDPMEEGIHREISELLTNKRFDLGQAPLIAAYLYPIEAEQYLFVFVMHHIISDAWSATILTKELIEIYQSLCSDVAIQLPDLSIQYKDYAHWQNKKYTIGELDDHRNYWTQQLSGNLPVLNLSSESTRPIKKSFAGASWYHWMDSNTEQMLRQLSQQKQVTFFVSLLVVAKILLYRYSGDRDIIIGTTTNGRSNYKTQSIIGFFANLLPIRTKLDDQISFSEMLSKVQDSVLSAFQYEDYPFDKLVEDLGIKNIPGRNPIFDVLIEFIGVDLHTDGAMQAGNLAITPFAAENVTSKFDLSFRFLEKQDGVQLHLEYDTALFSSEQIQQMARHYDQLAKSLINQPDTPVTQVNYLTSEEQNTLLKTYNDTSKIYDSEKNISERFDERAEAIPNALALVHKDIQISYAALQQKVNAFAALLQNTHGVGPGKTVAIMGTHSTELITGILSIIKTGATFLPIDTAHPKDRIAYMLEDAAVSVLLLDSYYLLEVPPQYQGDMVMIDMVADLADTSDFVPSQPARLEDVAYMIYTSGSTGLPKGVQVSVKNILNYLHWANDYYFTNKKGFHFAFFTSIAFDLSLTALLTTLLRGDTLYLYNGADNIGEVIKEVFSPASAVNAIKLTPSHLNLLVHCGLERTNVQQVIVGGEELKAEHLAILYRLNPDITVHNEYGPTEATVGCSVATFRQANSKITIGKPIGNTQIYILDEQRQLVPPFVRGELYIGGLGVAQGYQNQPELTRRKFLSNPFGTDSSQRIYQTGDTGYWLPTSEIIYTGRNDDQVKINGYRIELGEIEREMRTVDSVREAAVAAATDKNGNQYLCGYVVGPKEVDAEKLGAKMQEKLPAYMVPSVFYQVPAIPLTVNGKTDYTKLRNTSDNYILAVGEYLPPTNELEQWLTDIFVDLVHVSELSITQNLFSIGLDSLKVINAQQLIEQRFPEQLQIHQIFSNPSVQKIALLLEPVSEKETQKETVNILDF